MRKIFGQTITKSYYENLYKKSWLCNIWWLGRILVISAVLFNIAGCSVTVQGKKRPLVKHEGIKGDLQLNILQYQNERSSSGDKRKDKTIVFEERLALRTKGDLYNPNLMEFTAGVGLGLVQQKFASDSDSEKATGSLESYRLNMSFLRNKAYPFTIYLNRSDNLFAQRFQEPLRVRTESSGAMLSIRSKKWPMFFQWSRTETEQNAASSDAFFFKTKDDRFKYSVTHDVSDFSRLSCDFDQADISYDRKVCWTDFKQSSLTTSHDWIFGRDKKHRLHSFFSLRKHSGSFEAEILRLTERLTLQHTPNFSTNYLLRAIDSKQRSTKSRRIFGQASFNHRLYQSLVTTGSLSASKIDLGNQGEITQHAEHLGFSYQKKNRWGILTGSYLANLTTDIHEGGGDTGAVFDESKVFTDPLPIILDRLNIDTSTIFVTDSTGAIVYYENDDYTITLNNGRVELIINIFGSGGIKDGDTLLIDYNFLTDPGRKQKILFQIFNLRQRFIGGISLYFLHRRKDQEISSSTTEITPDEFRTNLLGADYSKEGFRLRAEHSETKSSQIPTTSDLIHASYNRAFGPDTKITIHASSRWFDFGGTEQRDVSLFTLGATAWKRLTNQLQVTARFDFRDEEDSKFGATEGIGYGTELRYDYRRLSIRTGVEINSLTRQTQKRDNIFAYFRLRRDF